MGYRNSVGCIFAIDIASLNLDARQKPKRKWAKLTASVRCRQSRKKAKKNWKSFSNPCGVLVTVNCRDAMKSQYAEASVDAV